jgi:hypothetical protein
MEKVPFLFAPFFISSEASKTICSVLLQAASLFFPMRFKGVPYLLLCYQGSDSKNSFLLPVAAILSIYRNHIDDLFRSRLSDFPTIVGALWTSRSLPGAPLIRAFRMSGPEKGNN